MKLADYVDKFGVPTKVHGGWFDGGDSMQRVGMYHSGLSFSKRGGIKLNAGDVLGPNSLRDSCDKLISKFGLIRRHPDPVYWYSDWDRGSRDQSIGMVVSLGEQRMYGTLAKMFLNHLFFRGLLFMTNTRRNGTTAENHGKPVGPGSKELRNYSWKMPDVTLFEYWALYLRALPFNLGYIGLPILLIADLLTLANGLIRNKNDDKDVLNFGITVVNARYNCPTPIMMLIRKYINWEGLVAKMEKYFDDTEPPLHRIWNPLLRSMKR